MENHCYNCGEKVTGKFCSSCGQKHVASSRPIKIYLNEAVESLFNFDNRIFKTTKELFLHPGLVTNNYVKGKRGRYVPPFKIYLSVSLIYFFVLSVVETSKFLFITIDGLGDAVQSFAGFLQYAMFFLVPVFAWIVQLTQRNKKKYYVEHLTFALHLHAVWFILYTFNAGADHMLNNTNPMQGSEIIFKSIMGLTQFGVVLYLVLFVKAVYRESWIKTAGKSFLILVLYMLVMAVLTLLYMIWTGNLEL